MISICKIVRFEAGHYLPDHPGECRNAHGHSYKVEVELAGSIVGDGMVMDFSALKEMIAGEVLDVYDHKWLNDIMINPTAENLLVDIVRRLKENLIRTALEFPLKTDETDDTKLVRVRLWETENSYAEWKNTSL
jgi:6-pyruvoyltetrahydropterin/6-carboxytetrahydropterin synthase